MLFVERYDCELTVDSLKVARLPGMRREDETYDFVFN